MRNQTVAAEVNISAPPSGAAGQHLWCTAFCRIKKG